MRISGRAWAELLLLSLVWGASFFTVAVALREIGPFTVVLFRVGIGAAALWAVVAASGLRVPRSAPFWGACLVMGALNNVLPFTLMSWGQTQIESGLTSILNGATALFGAVVAAAFLPDERLTLRRVGGVGLGMAGVAAVMGPEALSGLDLRSLAQLAVLAGALSYAFASVWARLRLSGWPPTIAAAGMLTASTIIMAALSLWREGAPSLAYSAEVWAALAYVGAAGTAGAYLLYYRILRVAGAANLMLCTLLIPPVAILLGWAFLGERLSPFAYLGFALIAAGLLLLDERAGRRRGRQPV